MFPVYDINYTEALYSIEVVEQFIKVFDISVSDNTLEDLNLVKEYCKDLLREILKGETHGN